jgi:hypothetical protein
MNTSDFTAVTLRAGSSGGDRTRIVFLGDNGGDYAQIVGTVTNPASGAGTPTGGSLAFRTRNGSQAADMRDQMTISSADNVGIGTAGGGSRLDVDQNIASSGNEYMMNLFANSKRMVAFAG